MSRERIIRITSGEIYLTPDYALPWTKTNLPTNDFTISDRHPFFWKILIAEYSQEEKILLVEVVDYRPKEIHLFEQQKMKYSINRLEFAALDWSEFEGFLASYKMSALAPYLMEGRRSSESILPLETFHYKIKAKLKDASFKLGYISIWSDLPALNHPVELQIKNHHILPEFEFIKSYFSKVFNRKTIEVDVHLTLQGTEVRTIKCHSKEIQKIDDRLVKTLKTGRVLALRKNPKIVLLDKHLFTSEDIFDQYDDGLPGNVFQQQPSDLLETLIELGMVRNRKQLEYLAGRKQDKKTTILITLTPHFGFLFTVRGSNQNHFIWELINSHATYVWSFDNHHLMEDQLGEVEKLIGLIREQGRENYKRFYQREIGQQNYLFQTIVHKHANAGVVDSFPNWRYRLEAVID